MKPVTTSYGLTEDASRVLDAMAQSLNTTPEEVIRRSLTLMREAIKSDEVILIRDGQSVPVKIK